MFNFLCDKKVLIGIGIGLILGTFMMIGAKHDKVYNKAQIEEKARSMGMEYPEEMRVLPNKKDVKKK